MDILRNNLQGVSINKDKIRMRLASGRTEPKDGFLDIEAKQLKIFQDCP